MTITLVFHSTSPSFAVLPTYAQDSYVAVRRVHYAFVGTPIVTFDRHHLDRGYRAVIRLDRPAPRRIGGRAYVGMCLTGARAGRPPHAEGARGLTSPSHACYEQMLSRQTDTPDGAPRTGRRLTLEVTVGASGAQRTLRARVRTRGTRS